MYERESERERKRERERKGERKRGKQRERDRDRQADRQTDREKERERGEGGRETPKTHHQLRVMERSMNQNDRKFDCTRKPENQKE